MVYSVVLWDVCSYVDLSQELSQLLRSVCGRENLVCEAGAKGYFVLDLNVLLDFF